MNWILAAVLTVYFAVDILYKLRVKNYLDVLGAHIICLYEDIGMLEDLVDSMDD